MSIEVIVACGISYLALQDVYFIGIPNRCFDYSCTYGAVQFSLQSYVVQSLGKESANLALSNVVLLHDMCKRKRHKSG